MKPASHNSVFVVSREQFFSFMKKEKELLVEKINKWEHVLGC